VLKHDVHLETSSAFDIPLILSLYKEKKIDKDVYIICNGYKRPQYIQYISELINNGFVNVVPILDNMNELPLYDKKTFIDHRIDNLLNKLSPIVL